MRIAVVGTGAVGSSVARFARKEGHTATALADVKSAVFDTDGAVHVGPPSSR